MSARLSPGQQPICGMLVHDVSPQLITARLGITPSELEAEPATILAVLAPAATRARHRPRHGYHWTMSVRAGARVGA